MPLAEADYTMTDGAYLAPNNRFFADDSLLVKFFMKPTKSHAASKEEGRPIFNDVVWINIMVPGNKSSVIERVARTGDKQRFSKHFAAFEAHGTEDHVSGTPLDAWPILSRSQVEEMRFFNIRTVEQLAALTDDNAQKFMGIGAIRTKARMFLEAAQGGAPMDAMQADLDEKENEIQAMKASLEAQAEMIAELQARMD